MIRHPPHGLEPLGKTPHQVLLGRRQLGRGDGPGSADGRNFLVQLKQRLGGHRGLHGRPSHPESTLAGVDEPGGDPVGVPLVLPQVEIQAAAEAAPQDGVHQLDGVVVGNLAGRTDRPDANLRLGGVLPVHQDHSNSIGRGGCRQGNLGHGTRFPAAQAVASQPGGLGQGDVTRKQQDRIARPPVNSVKFDQFLAGQGLDRGLVAAGRKPEGMPPAEQEGSKDPPGRGRGTVPLLKNAVQPQLPLPFQLLRREGRVQNQVGQKPDCRLQVHLEHFQGQMTVLGLGAGTEGGADPVQFPLDLQGRPRPGAFVQHGGGHPGNSRPGNRIRGRPRLQQQADRHLGKIMPFGHRHRQPRSDGLGGQSGRSKGFRASDAGPMLPVRLDPLGTGRRLGNEAEGDSVGGFQAGCRSPPHLFGSQLLIAQVVLLKVTGLSKEGVVLVQKIGLPPKSPNALQSAHELELLLGFFPLQLLRAGSLFGKGSDLLPDEVIQAAEGLTRAGGGHHAKQPGDLQGIVEGGHIRGHLLLIDQAPVQPRILAPGKNA